MSLKLPKTDPYKAIRRIWGALLSLFVTFVLVYIAITGTWLQATHQYQYYFIIGTSVPGFCVGDIRADTDPVGAGDTIAGNTGIDIVVAGTGWWWYWWECVWYWH